MNMTTNTAPILPIKITDKKEIIKYVSKNVAELLKFNDYNAPCNTKYSIKLDYLTSSQTYMNWNNSKYFLSAPTVNEAVDWVEEQLGIFIDIKYRIGTSEEEREKPFMFQIYDRECLDYVDSLIIFGKERYRTKHEAINAAIAKAFDELGVEFTEEEWKEYLAKLDAQSTVTNTTTTTVVEKTASDLCPSAIFKLKKNTEIVAK